MTWDHEGSRHERGYGYEWVKLRLHALRRDNHLCQPCLRDSRATQATEVDHIIPKALDGTDDFDNLQSICTECHKAKTKAETYGTRRGMIGPDGWPMEERIKRWGYSIPDGVKPSGIPVTLVSGPPAAGKSTYIEANATSDDLVIDFDAYRKRAGGTKWDTSQAIWRKAYKMRDADIRSLAARDTGKCFLIVTAPTQQERDTWVKALVNAQFHIIRTPENVCIERIKANPERQEAADSQIEGVKNWWRYN